MGDRRTSSAGHPVGWLRARIAGVSVRCAATQAALAATLYLAYRIRVAPKSGDLAVYRATGAAVRHGRNLYDGTHLLHGLKATYPPFAALAFVPLSYLRFHIAVYVVLVLSAALIVLLAVLSCRLAGVAAHRRRSGALLVTAAAFVAEPVAATLNLGQIDLLIVVLVLADLVRVDGAPLRGAGVGVAAGLKLTPTLFIVYFVVTGRYREAVTATSTFVLTVALGWLVLPAASRRYWGGLAFDTHRVGTVSRADNQSLRGLLARVAHRPDVGPTGILIVLAVGLLGLWLARTAWRRLGAPWGDMACAVTALLISPISWTHHWVWCVPIAVLLAREAPRWTPIVLVFWSWTVLVPYGGSFPPTYYDTWRTALSGTYVYFGLVFLALVAKRIVKVGRPSTEASTSQVVAGRRKSLPRADASSAGDP